VGAGGRQRSRGGFGYRGRGRGRGAGEKDSSRIATPGGPPCRPPGLVSPNTTPGTFSGAYGNSPAAAERGPGVCIGCRPFTR